MDNMIHRTPHTAHRNNSLKDSKLLSVIIPAYNTAKFLNKCVESVANQTYKNIEIIIVDDGSQDNTPQICDELANKFNNIKVIHQENQGSNITRRNGFNASRGEYIAFVDSDDYIYLNSYETAIKILEENNADMVQFGIYDVDLDGKIIKEWQRDDLTLNNASEIYKYFLTSEVASWPLVDKVYKRSLFENLEWPKISMTEDYCISAQLFARAQKFMTINKFLYYYVQNPASLCHDKPKTNPKIRDDIFTSSNFVVNLTGQKFPELLPYAIERKMGAFAAFLADFSEDIWPQIQQSILKDYQFMRSELKLNFIKFINRKLFLHGYFLAYHPGLYKFYLTTRLKIKALTGI
ncbi:MAG: glycosyltransferase family 2 protein [Synergistaceae bacterium]|nr:glycosyltransferase family 2 protein [Synergistaceae bacterium]